MKTKLNFFMVIALLLGLVFSSPAQPVSAQASDLAEFTFSTSLTPSDNRQMVTFTLSAVGTHASYQPFGYVYFYDNGALISGCASVKLNMVSTAPSAGVPAICATPALAPGAHVITALFDGLMPDIYADQWITLEGGQTVNDNHAVAITPDTLPDVVYGAYTNQQLKATWNQGLETGYVNWGLKSGSLPPGIALTGYGVNLEYFANLEGMLGAAGSFTFTIETKEYVSQGWIGTKTYTWNVLKASPEIAFGEFLTYAGYTYIPVSVYHSNNSFNPQPSGVVTVSIDGEPLAGCTNLIPYGSTFMCKAPDLAGLAPGIHTVRADFTPDSNHAANYTSAFATSEYTVLSRVEGLLYNDINRDGVLDEGEDISGASGYIQLDQGCDGSIESGGASDFRNRFSIPAAPGLYCLSVKPYGNWRPTTVLPIKFTTLAEQNAYFEIGFYDTVISINPDALPDATVGQYYEQAITIDGGKPPYKITNVSQYLPESMKFDWENLILSGMPDTLGDEFYLTLTVLDSDGMIGSWFLYFRVFAPKFDGAFVLASSANPSAVGQEVTFTFSGTGDAIMEKWGPVDPFGWVTFYVGDAPIEGCENLVLNIDMDNQAPADRPALCKTSALALGQHNISAVFTDPTGTYYDAVRLLEQVVQEQAVPSANLSISKTDSKDPVKPGAKLDYTLLVTNAGPDAAQGITLVDTLDRNTTYVSTSAPKGWTCSYANNKVTCTSSSLASGSSAVIKITVMVSKSAKVGKELVNTASISADTVDPDLLNNSVVQKTLVAK